MQRVEVAAVMAMATAKRASNVDIVIYGRTNALVPKLAGMSVLGGVDKVVRSVGSGGHATYGHTAIDRWFDPKRHQRAVIFTDDQQHDSGHVRLDHVPVVYTFNLAGYRPSALPAGERGRYTIGGFSDATFTAMLVIEDGRNAGWQAVDPYVALGACHPVDGPRRTATRARRGYRGYIVPSSKPTLNHSHPLRDTAAAIRQLMDGHARDKTSSRCERFSSAIG